MLRPLVALTILAGSVLPVPASAQAYKVYKWLDERGAVTYSDRRPIDQKVIDEQVSRTISLYTPDKALLQAVEAERLRSRQASYRTDAVSHRYAIPAAAPGPVSSDPCAQMDCTEFAGMSSSFPGSLPGRHRSPHLVQAVLPQGAIAGTVNAPGMIPGQTGSNAILPGPFNYLPAGRPFRPRGPLEPPMKP